MDNGAHFYNCDFQVHTPRDKRWKGQRALSEEERKTYGIRFIQECKKKGLDIVAITDHHDLCMFPYIKEASLSDETYLGCNNEKKVTVFPGIELTLANPNIQALLILNANFCESGFQSIFNKLSITTSPKENPTTEEIFAIDLSGCQSLNDLQKILNEVPECKGKFILLPNVTEGGHKTLISSRYQSEYKKMKAVGGYSDGQLSTKKGYLNQINGKKPQYGFKSIGVFQTSDNRSASFDALGKFSTWIKLAEFTSEAIRQACLAKETRISQTPPILPHNFISEIVIKNSKFLGTTSVNLNKQYNAIIGGRGTGKSTLLEYIRWVLCNETADCLHFEELSSINKKRKKLIERTIREVAGEVTIVLYINKARHEVKRLSDGTASLKIENGDWHNVTEEEIQNLFPIHCYSQKQLSEVGVRAEELKSFLEKHITNDLTSIKLTKSQISTKIKEAYSQILIVKNLKKERNYKKFKIDSTKEQINQSQKKLKGLTDEQQKLVNQKSLIDQESFVINQYDQDLGFFYNKIQQLFKDLEEFSLSDSDFEGTPNTKLIETLKEERNRILIQTREHIKNLKQGISPESYVSYKSVKSEIKDKHFQFETHYSDAKNNLQSNQQQLEVISQLEKELQKLKAESSELENQIKQHGSPEFLFSELRNKWNDAHLQMVKFLEDEAIELNKLANNSLKIETHNKLDYETIFALLKTAFSGSRIREDKIENICDYLKSSQDAFSTWNKIVDELRLIAEHQTETSTSRTHPATPILTSLHFNENNLESLCNTINEEIWIKLLLSNIEIVPEFIYIHKSGEEINFFEASAGQQATALLNVLLNQEGYPLIIDQPEDDIDNKAIEDVIANLRKAKQNRQIIFSSHNANLVVNGDAELVISFDYEETTTSTKGKVRHSGAIDSEDIKNDITVIMEGGKKAFKLRKEKYGY